MNIFITGATGFIGRPTVETLIKAGHKVLILCRDRKKALEFFPFRKNLSYVEGDLSEIDDWFKNVEQFKPETAIHLAWEGIPDFSLRLCVKNFNQSIGLFDKLYNIGCKKIVGSGSCFEYGLSSKGKIKENNAPRELTVFSATKRAINQVGKELARGKNAALIWARLFYVYGPGQRATSLIPHLIYSKFSGKKMELKNPYAENDFIYVSDAAQALVSIVQSEKIKESVDLNVGSGKLTTVRHIADLVSGTKSLKKTVKGDGFYADISKINKITGWKPLVSISEGIEKTIAYYKNQERL